MGLASLDTTISHLINQGISPATRATYQSGWLQYTAFCTKFNITPLPVTEDIKISFAAHLSRLVNASTIRSYLCAIRFYQIRAGLPDPSLSASPRLSLLTEGNSKEYPKPYQGGTSPNYIRSAAQDSFKLVEAASHFRQSHALGSILFGVLCLSEIRRIYTLYTRQAEWRIISSRRGS